MKNQVFTITMNPCRTDTEVFSNQHGIHRMSHFKKRKQKWGRN